MAHCPVRASEIAQSSRSEEEQGRALDSEWQLRLLLPSPSRSSHPEATPSAHPGQHACSVPCSSSICKMG